MKLFTNTNRSGKPQQGGASTDASGTKINPRGIGVVDFEVFLIAKGLSDSGVGALINPEDYFQADKSQDVYAFLCARSTTVSSGPPMGDLDVYPVFFIAHVAGMSDEFEMPDSVGRCRTLCLDVVQRVGVGTSEAGMQSRIYMNLHVKSSADVPEGSPVIFRPSWDKYLSAPDSALHYSEATYDVEWPISPDNQIIVQVKNKGDGYFIGPLTYLCNNVLMPKLVLRTSDIPMENNWSIWCGQAGSEEGGTFQAAIEFAASLSFPIARISTTDSSGAHQSPIWMCLFGSYSPNSGLLPIAFQPATNTWNDVADPNLYILSPSVLLR